MLVSWKVSKPQGRKYQEWCRKNSRQLPGNRHRPQLWHLSENHEFKAAKEMQKCSCATRRTRTQLTRAAARFCQCAHRRRQHRHDCAATDLVANQPERSPFSGCWIPTRTRASSAYLSPVAQSLLNNTGRDEVEFELHGAKRRHRIERIEACRRPHCAMEQRRPFRLLKNTKGAKFLTSLHCNRSDHYKTPRIWTAVQLAEAKRSETGAQRRHRFRLRTELPKRRGASLPAALQKSVAFSNVLEKPQEPTSGALIPIFDIRFTR